MIDALPALGEPRIRRTMALAILLAIAAALAGVLLLGLAGWFLVGAAIAGAAGPIAAQGFNYLLPSAGIRALAIIRTAGRYGERLLSHQAALHTIAAMRPALFARLAARPPRSALAHAPGEVATRFGDDVDALQDRVIRRVSTPAALTAGGVAVIAAAVSSLAAALALLFGLLAMRLVARRMTCARLPALHREEAEARAALKAAYSEYAPCGVEIAVYGLDQTVSGILEGYGERLDQARLALVRAEVLIVGTLALVGAATVALLLGLAGDDRPLAALATLAATAAIEGWGVLARSDMEHQRIAAALARLAPLQADTTGEPAPAPAAIQPARLGFADGTQHIALDPGERLLVAGPSGSGKTRLIGTLLALRDDAPQEILVDGVAPSASEPARLRQQFGFAPQDAGLIAGTIADNLRMARTGVTEPAMWEALDTACIGAFVRALSDGLDHWLSGDNATFSGGQRKRLALARALLAGRPWLVLDEPTEGLDAMTEAAVIDNLERYLARSGCGLVLVSHRTAAHRLVNRRFDLDATA